MTKHVPGLDAVFHALADSTRRAVVERLTSGPASVSDLAAPHGIALPTFLRHLKVREDSGLVRSEKRGRVRSCQIEAVPIAAAVDWLSRQRRIWDARLDPLDVPVRRLEEENRRCRSATTPSPSSGGCAPAPPMSGRPGPSRT